MRILVLDDNPDILEFYRIVLAETYQVTATESPFEAIQALELNPDWYTAAIVDFRLPGYNGAEVVSRMKQCCAHLPVLLCTGLAEQVEKKEIFDLILEKPFSPEELRQALQLMLSRRSLKSESKDPKDPEEMLRQGLMNQEFYMRLHVHPKAHVLEPEAASDVIQDGGKLFLWFSYHQIRTAFRKMRSIRKKGA